LRDYWYLLHTSDLYFFVDNQYLATYMVTWGGGV